MILKLGAEEIEAFQVPETFVPENLRPGLQRYLEEGVPTGNFLEAVLCNDLKGACLSGDPVTVKSLPTIVKWLWNFAPANSHGNENHVRGWMDARQRDAIEARDA